MPNDIALDFEKIDAVSLKLNNANETILPMLTDLQTSVNEMLEDGMVLRQSSTVIRESYTTFNTSLTAAINGIKSFAEQFRSIKDSLAEYDGEVAKSIKEQSTSG